MSWSISSLADAFSTTSSRTLRPLEDPLTFGSLVSVSSSVRRVCCRMAILVLSGIPGMSLSAMAVSKALGLF